MPLLLLLFILISCDSPSGTVQDYPKKVLSKNDSLMVSYQEGDSIPFVHSSGVSFYLIVDSVVTEQTKRPRTSIPDPEEEVEVLYTYLSSQYPYLNIMIRVVPQTSVLHSAEITINDKYSYTLYGGGGYSMSLPDTVNITLGSKSYSNVLRFNVPNYYNDTNPTSTITIDTLLYSQEFGILQIGKNNGETYTINQ